MNDHERLKHSRRFNPEWCCFLFQCCLPTHVICNNSLKYRRINVTLEVLGFRAKTSNTWISSLRATSLFRTDVSILRNSSGMSTTIARRPGRRNRSHALTERTQPATPPHNQSDRLDTEIDILNPANGGSSNVYSFALNYLPPTLPRGVAHRVEEPAIA